MNKNREASIYKTGFKKDHSNSTKTLPEYINSLSFQYPFSVCPIHFTGRGFRLEKQDCVDLFHSEIKTLSLENFLESLIPAKDLKADFLELDGLKYEIINKAFLEFLHKLEHKEWNSGFDSIYTEALFHDLKRENVKIGLSLRVYVWNNRENNSVGINHRYKVFCKLWK